MANNDGFRRYLEAGAVLGAVTRARAEEIVQDSSPVAMSNESSPAVDRRSRRAESPGK